MRLDPAAEDLFAALREGSPLPPVTTLEDTEPSAATIRVPVVDHTSLGRAADVNEILGEAGFIPSGIIPFDPSAMSVKGTVIAYEPGHDIQAKVVAKYFPNLKLVETDANALADADVAVFVTAAYESPQPGNAPNYGSCMSADGA